jgi:Tol biopolymer transport system component
VTATGTEGVITLTATAAGDTTKTASGQITVNAQVIKLAYNFGSGQYTWVYTILSDGTGRTQLTQGPYTDVNPSLAPDGKSVVFADITSGKPANLAMVDQNGRRPIILKDANGNTISDFAWYPSYSPDGKKIAFIRAGFKNRFRTFRLF